MKIAFMDRDGTIVKGYPDEKWKDIKEPEIIDGALETMSKILENGYEIIIITNQYIIGEPEYGYSLEDYNEYTKKLMDMFKEKGIEIRDIYYCPHGRHENCNCIKPKPGMIQKALEDYPETELEKSFLIGDSKGDMELASHFGLKSFGIGVDFEGAVKLSGIRDVVKHI
ncbi:D-glycero-D-manno-heptose 1,7-bisphosphate phosphatase [Peptoclostridium litorale DSM 5388]|uniref:D,D-heptose 1,7-bisphosphate phosphatase n=1 Tax=Peptoclostridium litorale DSM 5388 TaxID=1121324 RepID=A0A069RG26_PEPLI|nr:HAD-IIIA family hydrolase [Peptoclostridium litorale]KDR95763.1 D,D-heptose 1,7-bisphosphate phosphatase [Peptoclostridium litorale DSM 5388]SIO21806.1 D-glycero-D-manno-heptose 1,7-bisphosphate phosphatase [Peptoclostridium litorale DSM 5388]